MNSTYLNEFIDFVIETEEFDFNDDQIREFITDFISTISNNSNDNFNISLENVAKWLGVREKHLRYKLYNDYVKDEDYTIISMATGRRPKLKTYIRIDVFKNLCLASNTTQGKMIRKYFITIEKAYREYMISGIKNRLRIDQVDYYDKYPQNKKIRYPSGPCVYIIKIIDRGNTIYKIGETENLNRRLNEHKREIPGEIELVLFEMYQHNEFLESCIHTFLKDSQILGLYSLKDKEMTEIFEADVPQIIRTIRVCKMFRQSPDIKSYIDGNESYSSISDMFTTAESDN